MDTFSLILAFVFGTIIGSFLNVISLRFNTGKGIGGRSGCMSCGKSLTWIELVPIFSFLAQKGACRKCASKISWQYPLVEFSAGIIFTLVFLIFPPTTPPAAFTSLIYIISSCLLMIITVYDIKHKIIPNQFAYAFAAVAFVGLFIGGTSWWHVPGLTVLLAGPILALPFAFLWVVSKGTWMGLGDAKLALGMGWLLGLNGGVNAVILAFWIGAVASVLWLLVTYRRFKPRTEVPFGPYLILGLYLVLLFRIQVLDINLLKDIILSYL